MQKVQKNVCFNDHSTHTLFVACTIHILQVGLAYYSSIRQRLPPFWFNVPLGGIARGGCCWCRVGLFAWLKLQKICIILGTCRLSIQNDSSREKLCSLDWINLILFYGAICVLCAYTVMRCIIAESLLFHKMYLLKIQTNQRGFCNVQKIF